MGQYTHYLTVREEEPDIFRVRIDPYSPLPAIKEALGQSSDLRYSPILPAYLTPNEEPGTPPSVPASIAFFFAPRPYYALGRIRPGLSQEERERVFFTEGLASIVIVDCDSERAHELRSEIGCSEMEFWSLRDGVLAHDDVVMVRDRSQVPQGMAFDLAKTDDPAVDVYVEQVSASITTLWAFYGWFFPEERSTLTTLLELTKRLIEQYIHLTSNKPTVTNLRQQNAIISALVELSASLSYSTTQGTSGASPLLSNRSPFPHHSLLGVAGAVRALTNFTRYLECAFQVRGAAEVITNQYSTKLGSIPTNIADYGSGPTYQFKLPDGQREEFDSGGEFTVKENIPLLTHFSLRHGFKEAKFSVTAASESLTAESLPAWTLMTLSHEIMHSRVRDIFQALFGVTWDDDNQEEQWETFYTEFHNWYKSPDSSSVPLTQGIRNAVLHYCLATERAADIVSQRRDKSNREITINEVRAYYRKHRRLATEIFVHFHDYYFAYACQPKLYVMSLWASWTTVAAPVARPTEYLVRTLATIACGTGLEPDNAFAAAVEIVEEGLDSLEAANIRSPLFDEIRSLLSGSKRGNIYVYFKPAYYLIDQVRKHFASPTISSKIDRIESDPFAEGSTIAEDYSASIYVHGDQDPGKFVSPIRYSLAAFVRRLSAKQPIDDLQWLTAWNTLVISSQEVGKC